jgi:regulator of replication initiation timing
MAGPETAERSNNRDILIQQIRNPATRDTLRRELPTDTRVDFSGGGSRGPEIQSNLAEIARVEKGNAYKYIFGITTVAQTPDQLANAFGAIRALSDWRSSGKDRTNAIETAQNEFLATPTPPMNVSPDARSLEAEFKTIWDRAGGDARFAMRQIDTVLRSKQGDELKRAEDHFAEAYLATILDSTMPLEMRQALLNSGHAFNLGSPTYLTPHERRFDENVSFWKSAKPAWLFPEIFGVGADPEAGMDPKDREITLLKRQVSDLLRRGTPDPALEAKVKSLEREKTDLQTRRTRLESEKNDLVRLNQELTDRVSDLERRRSSGATPDQTKEIADLESKVATAQRNYSEAVKKIQELERAKTDAEIARSSAESRIFAQRRELDQLRTNLGGAQNEATVLKRENARLRTEAAAPGKNPVELLKLNPLEYSGAAPDEKRRIVDAAFRALSKRYHYDKNPTDPDYDEVKSELCNIKFREIKDAYTALRAMI